jgi:pimeloyl-ACP methyl ester carboxylesterase
MRGEFVEVGGARLYYYAAGTRGGGEPVVFLHGFPTSSHLWNHVVPLVPPGHRIVVADLLGFGRSDPPEGRDLSVRGHGQRTVGLLDALGIARAVLVGHDMGGGISLDVALQAPARVSRLCLVNPTAVDAHPEAVPQLGRSLASVLRYMPSFVATSTLRSRLRRGYVSTTRGSHSIDQYLRPFTSANGQHALRSHLGAQRHAGGEHATAGQIMIPAAVLWGAEDPFLRSTVGERLRTSIPGATMEMIPGARHFLPEEDPQVVARVLADLLRR